MTGAETSAETLRARVSEVLSLEPRALCEIRLDALQLTPKAALDFLNDLPLDWAPRLVLTLRHRESGPWAAGLCDWELGTWREWWTAAAQLRPWYAVDLDWFAGHAAWEGETNLPVHGGEGANRIFFSYHGSIEELESVAPNLLSRASALGYGIKIAVPADGPFELAALARFRASLPAFPIATIVAMGAAGRAWRWSKLAGDLTYFAYDAAKPTAAGQDDWRTAAPYFSKGELPRLFVLWGTNPKNRYGETRWNEIFRRRRIHARYIALACQDPFLSEAPPADTDVRAESAWAEAALEWMGAAEVEGASVTQPFKTYFSRLENTSAINTIYRDRKTPRGYSFANTDGVAVRSILADVGALADEKPVLVIGGGGAGEAVASVLGDKAVVWKRNHRGELDRPPVQAPSSIVATWPPEHGVALAGVLEEEFTRSPEFLPLALVDAQFLLDARESPLALVCARHDIQYVPGTEWWQRQARGQAAHWFGGGAASAFFEQIAERLPSSKSETLRALAIAVFLGREVRIESPALCADTEHFREALTGFGLATEVAGENWIARPREALHIPESPVFVGESAAALRFLGALSVALPKGGTLLLDGGAQLRTRPLQALLETLRVDWDGRWPLRIPTGLPLPREANLDATSQVASGLLIAIAALVARGEDMGMGQSLKLTGALRSLSYVHMTGALLEQCGFRVTFSETRDAAITVNVEKGGDFRETGPLTLRMERDASGLAFLETVLRYLGAGSLHAWLMKDRGSRQGDAVFAEMLGRMRESSGEYSVSLADAPDLAPALAAAALLFGRDLRVHSAPHLRGKESDRVAAVVAVSRAVGAFAEEAADGFFIAGSRARSVFPKEADERRETRILPTRGDHRIAMLIGALAFRWPELAADDPGCVEKSFPGYWDALAYIRESLP